MKLSSSSIVLLALVSSCQAWQQNSSSSSRRAWLANAVNAAVVAVPTIASAGLLDDFGDDPKKIKQKEEAPIVPKGVKKAESTIEPNLRSNYYYPTNKKRYLPRIKKCNDAIGGAANAIGSGDWESVVAFNDKIASDTILPLQLYTSSLSGGGTNVKVSFTKTMSGDAKTFEKNQKLLSKAILAKDTSKASTALEGMATALQDYRTVANLTGPDGGGDIPSVDEIRRAACRVQGRRFEQKVLARDERLANAASN
mmetsp:Transcript_7865/g.11394  ORF Transcript_7865/g.11394 Transcript_7865/m.11394 type:complete len:254 (-) Transcript_7865:6-767(-)